MASHGIGGLGVCVGQVQLGDVYSEGRRPGNTTQPRTADSEALVTEDGQH